MGAEDSIFNAFQRLIADLERYPSLPPGIASSSSPLLQSASVHTGPVARQPVIEVMETQDHVAVTVEMPGFSLETLEIQVAPDTLVVVAARDRPSVHIPLPAKVRIESIRVTERNGVLDVVLEKDLGDPGGAPHG